MGSLSYGANIQERNHPEQWPWCSFHAYAFQEPGSVRPTDWSVLNMKALLIAGNSVKQTALEVGYQQPSAFVEMFRSVFGTTPKVWTQSLRGQTTVRSQKS